NQTLRHFAQQAEVALAMLEVDDVDADLFTKRGQYVLLATPAAIDGRHLQPLRPAIGRIVELRHLLGGQQTSLDKNCANFHFVAPEKLEGGRLEATGPASGGGCTSTARKGPGVLKVPGILKSLGIRPLRAAFGFKFSLLCATFSLAT